MYVQSGIVADVNIVIPPNLHSVSDETGLENRKAETYKYDDISRFLVLSGVSEISIPGTTQLDLQPYPSQILLNLGYLVSRKPSQISLCYYNSTEDKIMIRYKKSRLCLVLQFVIWFCRKGEIRVSGWQCEGRHLLGLSANTSGDRFMTAILDPREKRRLPSGPLPLPTFVVTSTRDAPPPHHTHTPFTRGPFLCILENIIYNKLENIDELVHYPLTINWVSWKWWLMRVLMGVTACKSWLNVE